MGLGLALLPRAGYDKGRNPGVYQHYSEVRAPRCSPNHNYRQGKHQEEGLAHGSHDPESHNRRLRIPSLCRHDT